MRVDRVVTRGVFELDGGRWEVDNNIWLVGNHSQVVVFDAAHCLEPILDAVGDRHVVAVICTHGHNDHITVGPQLGEILDAPVLLHPADSMLWQMTHPNSDFVAVKDNDILRVGDVDLYGLHTPGHSPGSLCWYCPELHSVFSGDTLFHGGPGATDKSFSDFHTILSSISTRLGVLPKETKVYPGHGETTRIGEELIHYHQWLARGY